MKAPLPFAAALAVIPVVGVLLAAAADKPPRTFADVTCDAKSGTGALVRYRGDEDRDAFEDAAGDAFGLESARDETDDSSSNDDKPAKPKHKARKKPKPKTFRLKPGKDCVKRLEKLGGVMNDRVDIVPDGPGMTPDKIEKAFEHPGVWSRLSKMKFESPAALSKLFDNALNGDRTAIGALLGAEGTASAADAMLVRADGTVVKANPSGELAADFKVKQQSPISAAPPPTNPNPDSFEHEPTPQPSMVGGWVDSARQRLDDWRYGTIPDNKPFTLTPGEAAAPVPNLPVDTNGWAALPMYGNGFKFVGRGNYGQGRVVQTLMQACADPIADQLGSPMSIVAISLPGGGYFPPHITHRVGIDVDVALWGYHGGPLNSKAADRNLMFAVAAVEHMKPNFILLDPSRESELRTRANFLLSDPTLDAGIKARLQGAYPLLFTTGPAARGRKLFSYAPGHRDHFHIESRTGVLGR